MQLSEPLQFLKEIHETGVRYLLIGRQAVIAYGGPMYSMDYDIYIDGSKENTNQLLAVAKKFDLHPSAPREQLHTSFMFKLENDFMIDVFRARAFGTKEGKITFDEIYQRRNVLEGETGLKINVPSIDDLIALKRLRSLPKDLNDIEYLEALKKR
jgi:hypothetical protein